MESAYPPAARTSTVARCRRHSTGRLADLRHDGGDHAVATPPGERVDPGVRDVERRIELRAEQAARAVQPCLDGRLGHVETRRRLARAETLQVAQHERRPIGKG
jgi:hypothetical protein